MLLLEQISENTYVIETENGMSTLTLDEDGDWQLLMPKIATPLQVDRITDGMSISLPYEPRLVGHGKNSIDDSITITWIEAIKLSLEILEKQGTLS